MGAPFVLRVFSSQGISSSAECGLHLRHLKMSLGELVAGSVGSGGGTNSGIGVWMVSGMATGAHIRMRRPRAWNGNGAAPRTTQIGSVQAPNLWIWLWFPLLTQVWA